LVEGRYVIPEGSGLGGEKVPADISVVLTSEEVNEGASDAAGA
jgi:hypothetical protein